VAAQKAFDMLTVCFAPQKNLREKEDWCGKKT